MIDTKNISKHLQKRKWVKAKKRFLSGTIFAAAAKSTGIGDVLKDTNSEVDNTNEALSKGRKELAMTSIEKVKEEVNKLTKKFSDLAEEWDKAASDVEVKPRDVKRKEQMEEYIEDMVEAKADLIEQCETIEAEIEDITTGVALKSWAKGSKSADKLGHDDKELQRLRRKFEKAEARLDIRFRKHFKEPYLEIANDDFLHSETIKVFDIGIRLYEKPEESHKELISNKKSALSVISESFKTKMGFTQNVHFSVSASSGFTIDVSNIEKGKHEAEAFLGIKDELDELLEVIQDLQEDRSKLNKLREKYAKKL